MSWPWKNNDWRQNSSSSTGGYNDNKGGKGYGSGYSEVKGSGKEDSERRRAWAKYYEERQRADELAQKVKDFEEMRQREDEQKRRAEQEMLEKRRQEELASTVKSTVAEALGGFGKMLRPLSDDVANASMLPVGGDDDATRGDKTTDRRREKGSLSGMLLRELTRKASDESSAGDDRGALSSFRKKLKQWMGAGDGARSAARRRDKKDPAGRDGHGQGRKRPASTGASTSARKPKDTKKSTKLRRGRSSSRDDDDGDGAESAFDESADEDSRSDMSSVDGKQKRQAGRRASGDRHLKERGAGRRRGSGCGPTPDVTANGRRSRKRECGDGSQDDDAMIREQRQRDRRSSTAGNGGRRRAPPPDGDRRAVALPESAHRDGAGRGGRGRTKMAERTPAPPTRIPRAIPKLPTMPVVAPVDVGDGSGSEPNDSGADSPSPEPMYKEIPCLEWYDHFVEVGGNLADGEFDDAAFETLKLVTDPATFEAACSELAESSTTTKIDALCAACGVATSGSKKTKITRLLHWTAGL
jgi:hypothetical protein